MSVPLLLEAPSICVQGWHSPHMKSVFNAPASASAAAAAGNGWYMLYNHRGRENPHFSAVPSTENTDRKHSNHFKLQDISGQPEAWIQNRRSSEPDQQSHLGALCRSLIGLCDDERPSPMWDFNERKEEKKHSCESPLVCVSCEDLQADAEFTPIDGVPPQNVNTLSSQSREELLIKKKVCQPNCTVRDLHSTASTPTLSALRI